MSDSLADLEARITRGDAYLADHPSDTHAKALYYQLTDQYVNLWLDAHARTVVTLELPHGVAWARTRKAQALGTVDVVLAGVPRADNEMSRDDLAALLATLADVPERWQKEEA